MNDAHHEHDERHTPEHEALHRRSPSAETVHRAILVEGREELNRPTSALAWSGLAAGLAMGFSLVAEGVLRAKLPESEGWKLVTKLGYPVGFLFVMLGRQQLFTESTLVAVLPALHDKGARRFAALLRVWTVVLLGNLVGAFLFALAAAHTGIFSPEVREAFATIGHEAIRHSFVDDVLKGIAGGWLIALMVWMFPAAETAKFWTIIVTAYLIAAAELTHIVAGSVETLYLALSGGTTFVEALVGYMIPVLIGNTIGGVVFAAALNHAQVESGK